VDLLPYGLTWDDVDPARHPFEPAAVPGVVRALEPAARVAEHRPLSFEAAGRWTGDMTRALVEHYGSWAAGWRWGRDESELGGGPVASWCCYGHSITAPGETLRRVARSLAEWRGFLEDAAEQFARLPLDDAASLDRAVVRLVTWTVDRTGAGDAWYRTCENVLRWYLADAGVPGATATRLVADAIGGRFASWLEPAASDVAALGERLAAELAESDDGH
jgi:hypothetical protein